MGGESNMGKGVIQYKDKMKNMVYILAGGCLCIRAQP